MSVYGFPAVHTRGLDLLDLMAAIAGTSGPPRTAFYALMKVASWPDIQVRGTTGTNRGEHGASVGNILKATVPPLVSTKWPSKFTVTPRKHPQYRRATGASFIVSRKHPWASGLWSGALPLT